MSVINRGRRQFLRGAGGFALALPVLPSLLQGRALAQALAPQPRFICMTTEHGGIFDDSMFPAASMLTTQSAMYADHAIKKGALKVRFDGSRASISKVL